MALGANTPSSMASASQNFDLIFNLKKKNNVKNQRTSAGTGKIMLCRFTGLKIVCAGPNFLCQNKIDLHIVPVPSVLSLDQKMIYV